MPKKFGRQTRRLKGGDKKKLQEKRNAVNKELAELIEKQKKATEEGDPTATLQAMIRDLQAKKKYLNRSETRVAERKAAAEKKADAAKEEANIAAAAKEQANMELEQNAFAEENAALNAATAAAKKQANMEAEQNGVLNAALEAEENIDTIAKEAAAATATERNNSSVIPREVNTSSNNGNTNSISNNGSTVMTNNGNTVMTNNGSTVMTNYNADTCPTIDADDFKTQTHLGANFLSLYGCFMLEGYDTKLCNPSGLLLKFHELSTIQLNNKAEAAIYIYLLNYKDTFNAILESTISNDKKIRKIIILRETTVRVLIHCFAYYALLCSDTNNDMVKQNEFSNSTDNFSPNTDNTIKPKAKTDTIISHYFYGETPDAIIKAHITSLFSIENIEKLAMDLFSRLSHGKEYMRLQILEQNAYSTVLQTFIEIEEELINSDISDTLLKIYMDEENSEVLKYFKAELIEGLKDKKAEDVLYNDILYSITISPVRFTSLHELAKKIISDIGNKTDDDLKPENLHNFLEENGDNPPSATETSSCETDRDLCLGSDMSDVAASDDLIENAINAETNAVKDATEADDIRQRDELEVAVSENYKDPRLNVKVSEAFIKAANSADVYVNAAKLTNDQTIIDKALLHKKNILVKILELARSKRKLIYGKLSNYKNQKEIIKLSDTSISEVDRKELARERNNIGNKVKEAGKSLMVFKPYIEELLKIDNDNNDKANNLLLTLKEINKT
jgi:hypothetical protein